MVPLCPTVLPSLSATVSSRCDDEYALNSELCRAINCEIRVEINPYYKAFLCLLSAILRRLVHLFQRKKNKKT